VFQVIIKYSFQHSTKDKLGISKLHWNFPSHFELEFDAAWALHSTVSSGDWVQPPSGNTKGPSQGSNPSFEALLLVGLLFKQMSAFYSFYISVDVLASTGFLPFFFWVGKHTWSFITISCFLGYLLLNNQFINREGIVLPFRAAMPQRARVLEFKDSSSMFLTILPVTSILLIMMKLLGNKKKFKPCRKVIGVFLLYINHTLASIREKQKYHLKVNQSHIPSFFLFG